MLHLDFFQVPAHFLLQIYLFFTSDPLKRRYDAMERKEH